MYNITDWNDHVTDPSNVFTVTDVEGNKKKIERAGSIIQQGTPMSALNFNNLETGVLAAYTAAVEAMLTSKQLSSAFQISMIKDVYLINKLNYPFNDSEKTIALSGENERTNTNYQVYAEIPGEDSYNYTVGVPVTSNGEHPNFYAYSKNQQRTAVGDIVIYDKKTNGFKIAFTGGAHCLYLNLYILGGR